jgi:uroporphyrinogen III methyltransferase/synthase
MENKNVLLPQAKVASKELSEGLVKLGAKVDVVPVYQTVEIEPEDVDFDHIDKILFTSGSTVRAFIKKFGKVPPHIKACCLGLPTQTVAKENDIDADILSH